MRCFIYVFINKRKGKNYYKTAMFYMDFPPWEEPENPCKCFV